MLAIRLQRFGSNKSPIYRVAVQEDDPSSGRVSVVAFVGTFNAHAKKANLNKEDLGFYLKNGAQPTPRVVRILNDEGIELPEWVKQSNDEPIAAAETPTEEPAATYETPVDQASGEIPTEERTATTETPPGETQTEEPPATDQTPSEAQAAPDETPTEEPPATDQTPNDAQAAPDETPTEEPGADLTLTACGQPECTGTIVDSYCDVCGSPADATPLVAAGAPASAAVQPPSSSQSQDRGDVTACTQPGCTGTIADGYCDVCGSPADATPLVAAGALASAATPAPVIRSRRTAVRRLVGVAAVLLLLASAVAFYRIVPGFSGSGPAQSTTVSSAPTAGTQSPGGSSSAGPTPASDAPITPTLSATPGGRATAGPAGTANAIQVKDFAGSARPFETVPIHGTYRGGADTFVQVQRWQSGTWLPFPVPAKTDHSGRFTARVEIPQPGRYRLRVVDLESGATSRPFVLVIKG